MAIVYSLLVTGQGELLLLPLQLTTPGFTEYFPNSAWVEASSQLLINLGGAGCIPGHLTTSSLVGNPRAFE